MKPQRKGFPDKLNVPKNFMKSISIYKADVSDTPMPSKPDVDKLPKSNKPYITNFVTKRASGIKEGQWC